MRTMWWNDLVIGSAAISCFLCSSVLVTIIFFPRLRSQHFLQITWIVVFCWNMTNVAHLLGSPKTSSIECKIQAILLVYFSGAAGTWVALLFYQYYCFILYRTKFLRMITLQLLGWIFPCGLTLLPVIIGHLDYGYQSKFFSASDLGVCSFSDTNRQSYLDWYVYFAFGEGLIFLTFVFFIAWRLFSKFNAIGSPLFALFAWPTIIVVTWLPWLLVGSLLKYNVVPTTQANVNALYVTYAWVTQTGTLGSIAFYINNSEARQLLGMYVREGIVSSLLVFSSSESNHGSSAHKSAAIQSASNSGLSRSSQFSGGSSASSLSQSFRQHSTESTGSLGKRQASTEDAVVTLAFLSRSGSFASRGSRGSRDSRSGSIRQLTSALRSPLLDWEHLGEISCDIGSDSGDDSDRETKGDDEDCCSSAASRHVGVSATGSAEQLELGEESQESTIWRTADLQVPESTL